MRVKFLMLALLAGVCTTVAPLDRSGATEWKSSMLQSNTDLSAATKRKKARPAQPAAPYQPLRRGFADPSFGPDGRPYQVPEYLRGQCYIDDGYGRFSACNNRI